MISLAMPIEASGEQWFRYAHDDSTEDQLDHWLQVAAPVPGFTGFAIGRSIWSAPLHAHLHHRRTAGGVRSRIAGAYLDFVRHFLDARDGTLPVQYEPET